MNGKIKIPQENPRAQILDEVFFSISENSNRKKKPFN